MRTRTEKSSISTGLIARSFASRNQTRNLKISDFQGDHLIHTSQLRCGVVDQVIYED